MNRQNGFTLIELLISIVIGLIVLSGVLSVYIAVIVSSSETLKSSKLNSQLMTAMSLMTNDMRRAGYWSYDVNDETATATQNPFNQEGDTALEVISRADDVIIDVDNYDDKALIPAGDCLVYSYDVNEDGVVSAEEYLGFRLNATNKSIEMKTSGEVANGANCTTGTWVTLTDPDVYEIETLSFNPKESACINSSEPNDLDDNGDDAIDEDNERDCYIVAADSDERTVETREITINLKGYLTNDPVVQFSLQQSVRIRNDLVRVH